MQGPVRPKHPDGEAFPLSVRKHRSSATSLLQEARLNRSQKMQEDQPDSRICQKPLNSFYRKRKIQENREWEKGRSVEETVGKMRK